MRVVPDALPVKTGLLVGAYRALVADRGEDAHGYRERRGKYLLLEECQRRLPDATAAVLLRRDEEIEVPGTGLEILRQRFTPQRGIDRVRVADGLGAGLDDAADRMGGAERHVELGLRRRQRSPPVLDVVARQPAADQVPVGSPRRPQTHR